MVRKNILLKSKVVDTDYFHFSQCSAFTRFISYNLYLYDLILKILTL